MAMWLFVGGFGGSVYWVFRRENFRACVGIGVWSLNGHRVCLRARGLEDVGWGCKVCLRLCEKPPLRKKVAH